MRFDLWWSREPGERFWMEITDRPEDQLGENLLAPQVNGAGREEWSYALVPETRPGDVVLHWHRNLAGEPAIVGWSEVTGPLAVGRMTWQAHGTRGRSRRPVTVPSWIMPCGGLNPLPVPVNKAVLTPIEPEMKKLRDELESDAGRPYFPFMFYRPGEIRAAQAYLTKFPARLVRLIPELRDVFPGSRPPAATAGRRTVRRSSGPGRQQDPALLKAIERHAVQLAIDHYRALGATQIKELGAPYDLNVMLPGGERHVEVKGSALSSVAVELTANEVAHARNFAHTDLVVVDEITWQTDSAGAYRTSGGNLRVWENWGPDDNDLAPTRYRYDLPA